MNRKTIALAVVASFAIVLIWYAMVFSRQSHSIHNSKATEAAANTQAASLRSQIAVLQQEKLQLPADTAKLEKLKAALPDSPALDKLVDDINNAANTAGVDWQQLTPTKPATYSGQAQAAPAVAGGAQAVNVALQINGASKQILDFVTKLNGISRLVDVVGFNMSATSAGKATAQVTTQIFFVPTNAAAPATP